MNSVQDMAADVPFAEFNLDSFITVEFRNWIVRETGAAISVIDVVNSSSLGEFVERITG